MVESGQDNLPPPDPGGFYEAVFQRSLTDAESNYKYYKLAVPNLDTAISRFEHFTDFIV